MPITDFLSCTDPLDEFESLSYHQTRHAKTYVTGLAAARSKTVNGIAREVFPAQGERALNKFLTEYDWDKEQLNHERVEKPQPHGETRWSQDGYIIIDDSVTSEPGRNSPVLVGSTITQKAKPSGAGISSTHSTPTTKRLIHLWFVSTRRLTRMRNPMKPRQSTI